jgi:acyl dehydratase
MALLTPELAARIGETAVYTAPEELGRASIRYFGLAVGDYNPLYVDRKAASRAGLRDVIAPPTLITETNQYMIGPRNHEGFMGHGWGIEIADTRLVRGGNTYEFFQHVHPDDVITATWELVDMTERQTSKGVDMLIITSRASYANQRAEQLCTNTETLIFTSLKPTATDGGAA